MFENSGKKLQVLAKVFFVLGVIASVLGGIILFVQSPQLPWLGFVTVVAGTFSSWVSSLILHAIGEATENSESCTYLLQSLEKTIKNTNNSNEPAPSYKPSNEVSVVDKLAEISADKQWRCKCGALNSNTTDYCPQCGNYK